MREDVNLISADRNIKDGPSPTNSGTFAFLGQRMAKPARFGFIAALGCVLGAVLGEVFLFATRQPPPPPAIRELCLLIDSSGSMNGPKLQEVKQAAADFVRRQDMSGNTIAIVGFGSRTHLGTTLTTDSNVLQAAIMSLQDGGSTRLDEGLRLGLRQFSASNSQARLSSKTVSATNGRANPNPVLLVFTDGLPDANASATAVELAVNARRENTLIVAVATGDADVDYLTELTGDRAKVVRTTEGQYVAAFQKAAEVIRSQQLVEIAGTQTKYSLGYSLIRIGGWTSLISLGVGLALILGQNAYMRRPLFHPREIGAGTLGGLSAGLAAGIIGQFLYFGASKAPALDLVGRIVAWAILGGLLGRGMAFFIPNFNANRGMIGGAIGGAVGSLGFVLAGTAFGDAVGRLAGCVILGFVLGTAIALVEQLAREACLVVHWAPNEKTTLSLGERPVILGSSREAHVYLPKEKGFPPVTALITFVGGKVEFENKVNGQKQPLKNGSKVQLGAVSLEIVTAR